MTDPHSFSKLDPDPHSLKKLDLDSHKVNADPKHWSVLYARVLKFNLRRSNQRKYEFMILVTYGIDLIQTLLKTLRKLFVFWETLALPVPVRYVIKFSCPLGNLIGNGTGSGTGT
jgi:hypothetical protein